MSRLVMMVPASRRACGRGALFAADGRKLFGPFRVLATASRMAASKHGNPTCDSTRPFGHPPAGTYLLAGSLPPGFTPRRRRARRFGAVGALLLTPEGGDARTAAANGRRYFYMHGGPPDRRGRLRPTLGGVRVADADLLALVRAMNDANAAGDSLVEIALLHGPDPDLTRTPARDRPGRRGWLPDATPGAGPLGAMRAAPSRGTRTASISLAGAALASLAFGLKRTPHDGDTAADPARRDFLALALLVAGGATSLACSGSSQDEPSPCEPVACDPADPWCPPSGRVCPGDVPPRPPPADGGGVVATGGGDVFVGGDVVAGDPALGDTDSGDPSSGDDGGGSG